MSQLVNWQVRHASIVLVAESPVEPTSIAPDALRSSGIVPSDWTVTSEIVMPIFAETVFANGIRMRTEGNRCIFQQDGDVVFPEKPAIYHLVSQYVTATELAVRYQAVGINWQLGIPLDSQSPSLLQTLLNGGAGLAGFQPQSIQLVKLIDGKTCNLTFSVSQGEVSVAVNYHHQLSDRKAKPIIATWSECQQHLRQEVIDDILSRNMV